MSHLLEPLLGLLLGLFRVHFVHVLQDVNRQLPSAQILQFVFCDIIIVVPGHVQAPLVQDVSL